MNPNCYTFWRELLLSKGFKEPYYTNLKFLKEATMNPNSYTFWRELLLGKGFKEPYYTNLKFLSMNVTDYPVAITAGYFMFVRENCKVGICEADLDRKAFPEVYISYDIGKKVQSVWATEKDLENIEQVIDATLNHDLLPLCIGLVWAAPLVEKLLSLETMCSL